jgi:hypothetical protein
VLLFQQIFSFSELVQLLPHLQITMSDNVASTSTSTSVPTASLPTVEEINGWNRDRVKGFLQEKSAELELEVNDIDVIYGQRVSGKVFLRLNEEQLTRDSGSFKLPYGPASAIAELVKQIQGGKRTSFSLTPCHIRQ